MDGCHPAGLIRAPQRFAPASSACEHRLMHLLDDRLTARSAAAAPAAATTRVVLRCGAGLADAFSTSAHHGPGGRDSFAGTGDYFHLNGTGHRAIADGVLKALTY